MAKEAEAQSAIMQYLAAVRILAFRMNTGAIKVEKRFFRFGVPGMADILAFPTRCNVPAVAWIECKAPKGKQTELQRSFQKQVEDTGHLYIVARSIDEVREILW